MNAMKKVLLIMWTILLFASCAKEDRNNMIVNQEEAIDRYISQLEDVRVVRNGGASRLVYIEGEGSHSLAAGDSVKFYYAGYVFSGGKGALFATNNPEIAANNDFPLAGGIEERVPGRGDMVKGLANGLMGARAGEKCDVVFSAKYGYGNTAVYNVPKMTPLIFEIWVEDIVKNKN